MKASHPVQQLVAVEHDPFAGAAIARVVPTTEAQREIWLADQLSRDASLAYNESISLYIDGQLDVAAMERALSAVAERHDALRATFGPDGLSMLVAAQGDMPMRHVDFGGLDAAAREAALAELRVEAVESPFDLAQGPLIRAVLASSGREHHELIITGHHIVCDGWAIGVLAKELMALYSKHAGAGSAKPLPPAESYADYALAQHDDAHCAVADTDNRWFAAQYATLPNPLDLPADRQRKSVRQFDSRREERIIEPPLVEAIKRFGSQHGASLFVTLFAVYGALLARLSGQSDLVVGVPAAGQAAEGSFGLVGHCVQLLPIRIAVEVDGPFIDLLAATRQRVLDAYEHQSCTFGSLLKTLPIERDASRLPLVSVLFNLDAAIRSEELSVAGLRVHLRSNPRRYENFELFLNACQNEDEIILEAQYGASLFDAATIARWLELYCECLRRVVAGPSRPVDEALAPTAGDQELLQRFNDSALDYPRGQRIEAMIARQATATPEAIAVVAGDRRLTYRELDGRATALAHRLRERGAAPGDLVGLYCGRNEHMVVALLGILKSGAGYVPMDPSFPADRLAYMSEDAKVRLIVSDASVDGPWAFPNSERIAADEEIASPVTFAPAGTADNVAYVIYTSGSTGRPKGVRVPHRSVGNLLASVAREPGMTNADSVLSVTTLSFDIAVSEVILPLTVGARIVIADRAQVTDGDRLRELIERERVDWIDATPSTWRLLLASGWTGGVSIKAICTGEPLPPDLGRELLPRVGELWNGYGPTETTVWSSFFRVKAIDGPVPIGRPVANTQFHVVDARQRTLPVGVSGELFIGGEGVTLGYLERPDLTAERFLPDPHRPGHCWYRTGDVGRWRSDGILECHGRIDHQIKLRGYRIELGEIEANLATHPQVDRALVVVREDTPGDARLVAYIVARGEPPAADALREHLRRTLPDYMLPQNVVVLSAIPLLPNGKIDRKSLPAPEASVVGGAKRAKEAPRNALEQAVLAAIEQILHLRDLGIDDDFFRMGGHSLLAAKLVATLNRDMKIKLPLRSVFEAPTARSLAGAVAAAVSSGQPARPPIRHEPGRQSAPLTPMQERVRFVETMQPGRLLYNTPTAHQLVGPFDHALFVQAFEEMVRRQPSLRTCIALDDSGGFVQQVFEQVAIEMPVQDLSHLDEPSRDAEFRRRVQAIVDTPIAIESAPLFRCALYRLEPQKHVFFFMAHHIVWDGWSFDLLYQEMSAIYGALVAGEPHRLPPLAATYGDYAFWLREWLAGPEAAEQLEYWRKRFAVRPQLRALRPDHARRGGMSGAGGVVHARIDPDTVVRLNDIATDAGVTLNMVALAVYAASIVDAAGLEALAVGVPLRGRLMHEIEPVMGFFNNTLPVDVTLNRDGTVADYLRSVKGQLLEMFARQDIPFEVLAADAEIGRRVSKDGFYQVMFSFQSARDRPRQWGPLEELQIPFVQKGATEDMGLWLRDDVDGLKGAFIYNADLFDRSTVDACKTRFLELLERLIANPRQKVAAWCAADGSSAGATLRRLAPERGAAEANLPSAGGGAGRDWKRGELEAVVATTWADILGVSIDDIGPESGFFEIGGSSLLAMNVVTSLEKRLGKRVSPAMLIEAPTVPKLAAAIAASPRPESLVSIRAGTGGPAVFMIHDGDGATLLYRNLAYRLHGDRPVYGLQPLVDEHGVLQHTRIEEMATHYVETMRRVQPEGPYLVGGLCAGGVIAFEVALQLQKLGASVGMVALIDAADVTISESATNRYGTRFKRLASALTEVSDLPLPQRISRTVGIVARKARNVIAYEASSRVEEARRANEVRQMQSRIDNDGATRPSDAQVTFRQIYDVAAREYRQSDRLQGNVVLFRATRGMGDLGDRPLAEISSDPTLGWQAHVVEPIRCVDIAGGHSSMLQEPNVDELAAAMQSCIDNALEGLRARCSAPPELP